MRQRYIEVGKDIFEEQGVAIDCLRSLRVRRLRLGLTEKRKFGTLPEIVCYCLFE